VLAGPGEGWKVADDGNVVGVTTGRPVLRLEDLLIALRSVENAAKGHKLLDRSDAGRPAADGCPARAAIEFQPGAAIDDQGNARAADDYDHGRAGREPFRPRAGVERFSHEAKSR